MKQKNQVRFLIFIILMGGLYGYIQYLLTPQWDILKQTSGVFAERKAYLERLENSNRIHSSLQTKVVALSSQEAELRENIPILLDKPEIMMTVYNLAKSNGLSPQTLTYEQIQDEGDFISMGMNFACAGPLDNVFNLVEQFRQGKKHVFTLDSIDLSEGEEGFTVNMRIVAHAYK